MAQLQVCFKQPITYYCSNLSHTCTCPWNIDIILYSFSIGLLVYIKHPYPRNVSEFVDYEEALFTEGVDILGRSLEPSQTPNFSVSVFSLLGF